MPETDGTYALFLDFDGTLVDIVERPDAVVVDPGLPEILTRLEQRLGGALAIISGRPVEFLDGRFVPHEFDMAGLHGLEHRIAGQLSMCDPVDHPALRAMVGRLREIVAGKEGILIEDKGCSVAIHWRLAPHEKEFALATAQAAVEALGSDYRVQHGKAVAEILPSAAGKGKVIERFLHEAPYQGAVPDLRRRRPDRRERLQDRERPRRPLGAHRRRRDHCQGAPWNACGVATLPVHMGLRGFSSFQRG